ncbi:MAG TPA: FkbM family methyltransferase [Longimicrobiales bacterium]|jgi:FkbM family methyltransferase
MTEFIPSKRSFVGRVFRLPLAMIPKGRVVRVLLGPGRGLRWVHGSGPASVWLGFNEVLKRRAFARTLRPGDVVYDIGAHVGSYTLLASRLVGEAGRVLAFEPDPASRGFLREHVLLNAAENVEVREEAVSSEVGRARFESTPDRVTSRLRASGRLEVVTTTLDRVVREGAPAPSCLKIDVEGGEVAVLEGAREVLRQCRPSIFLATHGAREDRECRGLLRSLGYDLWSFRFHPDELFGAPSRERAVPGRDLLLCRAEG